VVIDTADAGSIASAAAQVLDRHPDLNVLIPMAGIMRAEDWRKPESFLESAESVLTTNVLGPVRLIAAFIEHLRSRPDATIITVSSGLAFTSLGTTPSYNASQHDDPGRGGGGRRLGNRRPDPDPGRAPGLPVQRWRPASDFGARVKSTMWGGVARRAVLT
jgi:hypothetical protein